MLHTQEATWAGNKGVNVLWCAIACRSSPGSGSNTSPKSLNCNFILCKRIVQLVGGVGVLYSAGSATVELVKEPFTKA